jgi:thiosulfate/3-mercaptopyruvate sulfurtransferase
MLAEKLASIGIDSTPNPTPVVIYDDNRFAFAARCWWLLRYLGHANIQLLDGGFAAWRAAGFDVTSSVPTARRGNFQARVQQGWTVDHAEVAAISRSGGAVLIDSREPPRFRGEVEPIDPVAGHIPGAVNFSWQEVTDEQGFVTAASQHNERWRELAGADKVVYCGSGVTACVNLLSLELAGLSGRLYPGSWSDWCQREGYPVER